METGSKRSPDPDGRPRSIKAAEPLLVSSCLTEKYIAVC